MLNDARYPVTLFIASFIVLMIGLWLKFMNYPGARLTVGSMLIVQLTSIVWLIIIIIKSRRP